MTECIQSSFEFARHCSRAVVARFDASVLTSDAGALLPRQVDQRIRPLSRMARCFTDYRRPDRCDHSVSEMAAQRVCALALGYEDLNDHDQLRLYLSRMAYVLVEALRRLGLKGTEMGRAQVQTIRLRLLKIGARIRITARKVWISMASSYPWQVLYRRARASLSG